jgi:hypothetical protein
VKQMPPPHNQNGNPNQKCRWTNDPGIFLATVAGVIAVIIYAGIAAWQACLLRDQIAYANPPKMKANHFEIWETGKGAPFDPSDTAPPWVATTSLSGVLLFSNYGSDTAFVTSGGCIPWWQPANKLPMVTPLSPFTKEKIWPTQPLKDGKPQDATAPPKMRSGDIRACSFTTTITDPAQTLFVLGYAAFKYRLGIVGGLYYARRYDPGQQVFVRVEHEPNYENEEAEAQ